MLFHFTAQYAPQGDIGRYSDKRIAAALDWTGPVQKLMQSLTTTGWVDFDKSTRLVVHDWCEHADRSTLQRLSRQGKMPIKPNHEDAGKVCTQIESVVKHTLKPVVAPALPEPEPEPVPFLSGQSSSRLENQKQEPNSKNLTTTDDKTKPKYATPKDELVALMAGAMGHKPEIGLFRKICEVVELRGGTIAEYTADMAERIKRLREPPGEGFFLSEAAKVGSIEVAPVLDPKIEQPKNGHGRCAICNGIGQTDSGFCSCQMGQDLAKVAARKKQHQEAS